MWNGRRPQLKHLQIFGTTAYVKKMKYQQKLKKKCDVYGIVGHGL